MQALIFLFIVIMLFINPILAIQLIGAYLLLFFAIGFLDGFLE
jgi:nitrate reductase NapE component